MKYSLLFLILLHTLSVTLSGNNVKRLKFHFGNTNINFHLSVKVFEPKGFSVSIPNRDGLELFSIHGNVNSPYDKFGERDNEVVSFAHDVATSVNDEWVYENKDITLRVGDSLNYWVFIQYKGAGQRFNDLSHVVKKLTPISSMQHSSSQFETRPNNVMPNQWQITPAVLNHPQFHTVYTTTPRTQTTPTTPTTHMSIINPCPLVPKVTTTQCECNDDSLKDVWAELNSTANKLQTLQQSIAPLEEKLNSLTETVTELIKNMDVGTKLLLTGNLPLQTNPVEDVRHLIVDKLNLVDLSATILQAFYSSNGITFEVSSSIDKLRILKRADDVLSKLSYKIIDPEKPDLDVRIARK